MKNSQEYPLGHPLYCKGEKITFFHNGQEKTGKISGVDAYGTFGQQEEPSYDIYIAEENCVYKHIRESRVIQTNAKEKEDTYERKM